MKKIVFALMLAFGFASNCHAQTWEYIQESIATFCSGPATSCNLTTGNILPTTPGTVWVVAVETTNNVSISSVTGGGGAWTICSACSVYNPTLSDGLTVAYNIGGTGGTNSITVNLSGSSGTNLGVTFYELLPPAGTTASFDTAGTSTSSTCTTACQGASLTLSPNTDAILQIMGANGPTNWHGWSSPYLSLPLGDGLYLNATSGAAPTINTHGTGAVISALAFKSSAGSFSPPPQPMSVVNYTNSPQTGCSPSCSVTIPSTGSGHLLYIEAANINNGFISSASGGGTWVVPTGANSCRISMVLSGNDALSCAYVLSSTAGTTSVNVTMTGSSQTFFAVWEIASTGGSFSLDQQGSATNSASPNPSGVSFCASGCTSPALTGSNDVIFQSSFVPGGTSSVSLYPMPRIPGQGTMFYNNQAASAALLNTTNGAAPLWIDQQNQATIVSGLAFKTGTGTVVAPPSGLTAVVN